MKILFLVTEIYPLPGGIQKYNHVLASSLGKAFGPDNILVIPFSHKVYCSRSEVRYQLFPVAKRFVLREERMIIFRWYHKVLLFFKIMKILLAHRIDLILCGHIQLGFWGWLFKKIFRKPYFLLTHGTEVWGNLRVRDIKYLKNSLRIVTVSEYTKNRLIEKGIQEHRVVLIRNSVDVGKFCPSPPDTEIINKYGLGEAKILLTVGRLASEEQYKGHDYVIRALPKIVEKVPNVKYLIVGGGDDEARLRNLTRKFGVEKFVIFAGFVQNEDLPAYYNSCDVFVMPSRVIRKADKLLGEGFGIVYLEANACGKAVIAGRSGGSQEAVVDGVTGLLVNPTSVKEITEAAIELLSDRNLATKMGMEGRERVVREFSEESVATRAKEIVEEALLSEKASRDSYNA